MMKYAKIITLVMLVGLATWMITNDAEHFTSSIANVTSTTDVGDSSPAFTPLNHTTSPVDFGQNKLHSDKDVRIDQTLQIRDGGDVRMSMPGGGEGSLRIALEGADESKARLRHQQEAMRMKRNRINELRHALREVARNTSTCTVEIKGQQLKGEIIRPKGDGDIKDLEDAKRECIELGRECAGITEHPNSAYTLHKYIDGDTQMENNAAASTWLNVNC